MKYKTTKNGKKMKKSSQRSSRRSRATSANNGRHDSEKEQLRVEVPGDWRVHFCASSVPVDCGVPPRRNHSTVDPTAKEYNEKADFQCDLGFLIDGILRRQ